MLAEAPVERFALFLGNVGDKTEDMKVVSVINEKEIHK
jgi:hypothetical protein